MCEMLYFESREIDPFILGMDMLLLDLPESTR